MSDPEKSARAVLDVPGVLYVLLQLSLAIACTHEHGIPYVESDSGTDADSDSDADAGVDAGPDWACPPPATAICGESKAYDLWIGAEALGAGYVFVDARGAGVLLAERPDGSGGTEPVLVTRTPGVSQGEGLGGHALVTLAAPPSEPLRAVDLVAATEVFDPDYGFIPAESALGYPAVTLLCSDSGCALYAMIIDTIDAAHLAPIPGGEVPIAEANGLVHLAADSFEEAPDDPICAFGNGIACFDGTVWTEMLAPGGPILLAATAFPEEDSWSPRLLASGASCRLVRQGADGFAEIPLGCDVDLRTVSADYEIFAAGGDGILVLGFPEETLECPTAGNDIALLRALLSSDFDAETHRRVTMFAQDGSVIEVTYGGSVPYACAFAEPLDGPARAWTEASPGYDAYGSMVVTESSAYWRVEFGGPGE